MALALDEAGKRKPCCASTPRREGDGPLALAVVSELPADLDELRARGIRAITVEFRPADLIGGVKSTSYALNMMAVDEARARGAEDAVFVAGDGTVLEATTSNVWWRRGRTLFTPAVDGRILAGVTRDVLLELASPAGYEVAEGVFPLSELAAADEAFASSSIREVMPIVALDGRPIGDGKPGEAAAASGGPPGARMSLRVKTLSAIHRGIYSATGGRVGNRIAGMPVLLLTTSVGRPASGAPRRSRTSRRTARSCSSGPTAAGRTTRRGSRTSSPRVRAK